MWQNTKREALEMLDIVAIVVQYGGLFLALAAIIDLRASLLGALAIIAGGAAACVAAWFYRVWRSNRVHVYWIAVEDLELE